MVFIRIILIFLFSHNHFELFSQQSKNVGSSTADRVDADLSKYRRIETLLKLSENQLSIDPFKALNYALQAGHLAEESSNPKQLSRAHILTGKAYFYHGLLAESIKYFYRDLEIQKNQGSPSDLANAYANLGAAWLVEGNVKKAQFFLLQALNIQGNKVLNKTDSISINFTATIYNNLSVIYRTKNELDKAEKYALESIRLSRNLKENTPSLIRSLLNYGEVLLVKKSFSGAYLSFAEALLVSRKTMNPVMEATSLYSISLFHNANGNPDSALLTARASYLLSKKMNNLDLIGATAKMQYDLYSTIHNADSALKYSKIVEENKKMVKADEARLNLATEELQSKFREAEQRHAEQIKKERLIYLITIALSIIVAGVVTCFYLRTRKKNIIYGNQSEKLHHQQELMKEELESNRKELTLSKLQQLQKNEIIENALSRLSDIESKKRDPQKLIQSALLDLKSLHSESSWKEFEIRFQQVDRGFYERLRDVCGSLSMNERRLCALLRLNMASKEIAHLTGQSIRSIEMARIRLRKKLNLTNSDVNLTDYITSI